MLGEPLGPIIIHAMQLDKLRSHELDAYDEDELFLMANVSPGKTGLPFVVWISPGQGSRHDIRIKVSPGPRARLEEMMTVQLRPDLEVTGGHLDAREMTLLRKWVRLNWAVLLAYWEGDIQDTEEALSKLKHVNDSEERLPHIPLLHLPAPPSPADRANMERLAENFARATSKLLGPIATPEEGKPAFPPPEPKPFPRKRRLFARRPPRDPDEKS